MAEKKEASACAQERHTWFPPHSLAKVSNWPLLTRCHGDRRFPHLERQCKLHGQVSYQHGRKIQLSFMVQQQTFWTRIESTTSWFYKGFKIWKKSLTWSNAILRNFPGGTVVKESSCNARIKGLIPGLRRCPGGGKNNPLQCSCLRNLTTEEPDAWQSVGSQASHPA